MTCTIYFRVYESIHHYPSMHSHILIVLVTADCLSSSNKMQKTGSSSWSVLTAIIRSLSPFFKLHLLFKMHFLKIIFIWLLLVNWSNELLLTSNPWQVVLNFVIMWTFMYRFKVSPKSQSSISFLGYHF